VDGSVAVIFCPIIFVSDIDGKIVLGRWAQEWECLVMEIHAKIT